MKSLLLLVRYKNLLIVGALQYLLRYCLLLPYTRKYGVGVVLDEFNFFLLVSSTILVAAGGYIINDIVDYPIDILNKPEKTYINLHISAQNALKIYGLLSLIGGILAFSIAVSIEKVAWWILYPLCVGLLYLYAVYLKKTPFWGNLVVAGFTSAVAIITILPLPHIPFCGLQILIFGYAWFAFWSNLAREVVKDAEDIEGDIQNDCQTLPIVWGLRVTKYLVGIFILTLVISLFFFTIWLLSLDFLPGVVYVVSILIFPFIALFAFLYSAVSRTDFYVISQVLKVLMIGGLFFLPFFSFLYLGG